MAVCIGGTDKENERKQRLLNIFGDWTDMVTDLIRYVTPRCDCLHPSWRVHTIFACSAHATETTAISDQQHQQQQQQQLSPLSKRGGVLANAAVAK